jgi:hypothetical protein
MATDSALSAHSKAHWCCFFRALVLTSPPSDGCEIGAERFSSAWLPGPELLGCWLSQSSASLVALSPAAEASMLILCTFVVTFILSLFPADINELEAFVRHWLNWPQTDGSWLSAAFDSSEADCGLQRVPFGLLSVRYSYGNILCPF